MSDSDKEPSNVGVSDHEDDRLFDPDFGKSAAEKEAGVSLLVTISILTACKKLTSVARSGNLFENLT